MLVGIEELQAALDEGEDIIFSGGACNYIDENGEKQRSTARDGINSFLNRMKILFLILRLMAVLMGENMIMTRMVQQRNLLLKNQDLISLR